MINANKQIVALALGLSVALVASQASAQNMTKRDTAISACVKKAHTAYPDSGGMDQGNARTAVYKACMQSMGQRP